MRVWEPMVERLARERYSALVAYAVLLVRDRAAAEDLVQEALVATFSARARFGSIQEAEGYVRRAVASKFLDSVRRAGRERQAAVAVSNEPRPAQAEPHVLGADLKAALAALSPRARACVVLRHMEDLSVRDTAKVLGLSEGAVKRYVSDAVAALGAALGTTVDAEYAPVTVVRGAKGVRRGA